MTGIRYLCKIIYKKFNRMNTIEIHNFGPIEAGYDGAMPIYPVTIFCGDQGAGKSTIAKLISMFTWMEKAFVRGDVAMNKKAESTAFLRQRMEYHRIQNYLRPDSELHFTGIRYIFHYSGGEFSIEEKGAEVDYPMPKIMYIPAERNFLTVVEHPDTLKEIPDSLFVLFSEYDKARKALKRDIMLPINGFSYHYDKLNNMSWLMGDGFKVRMSEAASGFQSLIPMTLVTRYITHIIRVGGQASTNLQVNNAIEKRIATILADNSIDENMRRLLISQQSALLTYGKFVNIVEEPEQNLFPTAQRSVLFDLFEAYNDRKDNQLIITTHSPYLIDYTSLAVKAFSIRTKTDVQEATLNQIVPKSSRMNGDDVCVYQIRGGRIFALDKYDNMPSDNNFLNKELSDTNDLFGRLLELEDGV